MTTKNSSPSSQWEKKDRCPSCSSYCNIHLDLDDIYDNIRHIIDAYPPDPSDLEIRLSNEILIRLLENEYSFEEIESLLEYNLIDEDFEWLLDNPEFVYEDIYHLLEDGLDIVSIKNLLGHANIETTMIYLHIAKTEIKQPFCPLYLLYKVS
jgi:hypothetical protein